MTEMKTSKIFRYKLCDDIMNCIAQFSKIHQLDDRHTYKDAWAFWLTENQDQVEREVQRLQQLDYKGDILDKMFKAGRYYFREKLPKNKKEAKPTKKTQRDYIVMDTELIQAMDTHLRLKMNSTDFKPALAYDQFCTQHLDLLRKEIGRLLQDNFPKEKIAAKLKKTYKNRYFILH
jgi:phage terminase Nu1 subunit (DNA packaging protein)